MTTAQKAGRGLLIIAGLLSVTALTMISLPALAVERGDKVTVNQPFNCGSGRNFRKSWEGTVVSTRGSSVNVRPSDRSWCRVPSIKVRAQRVEVKQPVARDCP
ncbi:MAG: hypothetical protein AAF183_17825 [Pseudomonadota bacterium]